MIVKDGLTEFRVWFCHSTPEKAKAQLRFHGLLIKAATTATIEKRWEATVGDGFSPWVFVSCGVAGCSLDDKYVKDVGRKLALKRAMRDWPRASRTKMWKAYFGRPRYKVVSAPLKYDLQEGDGAGRIPGVKPSREASAPRLDIRKLARALDAVLSDHRERVRMFGDLEKQPNRLKVMDGAERALEEVVAGA